MAILLLAVPAFACNESSVQRNTNKAPVAEAGDNRTVLVNELVDLDGSASFDEDGTIIQYDWDFGDGETDVGLQTNHAWTTPGTYTVTLTVTDNEGATGSDAPEITIDVEPYPGIYAAEPTPQKQPCGSLGLEVNFVATNVDITINGTTMDSDWHVTDLGLTIVEPSTGPISGDSFVQDSKYTQTSVDPNFVVLCGTDTVITTYTNSWAGTFNGDGTITSDLVQNIADDCGLLACSLTWGIAGTKIADLP